VQRIRREVYGKPTWTDDELTLPPREHVTRDSHARFFGARGCIQERLVSLKSSLLRSARCASTIGITSKATLPAPTAACIHNPMQSRPLQSRPLRNHPVQSHRVPSCGEHRASPCTSSIGPEAPRLSQLGLAARLALPPQDRLSNPPKIGAGNAKRPPGNRAASSLGRIVPTEAKPSELSGEILRLAKSAVKVKTG
jgi:hypothetical protein